MRPLNQVYVFALVFFLSSVARAQFFSFGAMTAGHQTYEVGESSLLFRLSHPFKMIVVSAEGYAGSLIADMKDAKQGMKLSLQLPIDLLHSPTQRLDAPIHELLKTSEHRTITFESAILSVLPAEAGALAVLFRGELNLIGRAIPIDLTLVCREDAPFLRCRFGPMPLRLAELGIDRPALLGVKSEEVASVQGQIVFKPKGMNEAKE